MDFTCIILSDRSQSQKTMYGMIPFTGEGKINGHRKQVSGCQGLRVERSWVQGATRGHLWDDGSVPHVDCGSAYTTVWVC